VLVDELKRRVSYRDRKWDGSRKAWWISKLAAGEVQKMADDVLGDYRPHQDVVFDFDPVKNSEAYIELHLWPGAPLEVAEAAHKALKKIYARDRLDPRALDDAISRIRGISPQNRARPQKRQRS